MCLPPPLLPAAALPGSGALRHSTVAITNCLQEVVADHGSGSYVWTTDGRRHLDFACGIGAALGRHFSCGLRRAMLAEPRCTQLHVHGLMLMLVAAWHAARCQAMATCCLLRGTLIHVAAARPSCRRAVHGPLPPQGGRSHSAAGKADSGVQARMQGSWQCKPAVVLAQCVFRAAQS